MSAEVDEDRKAELFDLFGFADSSDDEEEGQEVALEAVGPDGPSTETASPLEYQPIAESVDSSSSAQQQEDVSLSAAAEVLSPRHTALKRLLVVMHRWFLLLSTSLRLVGLPSIIVVD